MNEISALIEHINSKTHDSLLACAEKSAKATKNTYVLNHVGKIRDLTKKIATSVHSVGKGFDIDKFTVVIESMIAFSVLMSDNKYYRFILNHCQEEYIVYYQLLEASARSQQTNILKKLKQISKTKAATKPTATKNK